jgi:ATP-dependent protease HslVU (ClpYQ) peptidase subunit
MTICIAAICGGGSNVILASDSMIINEWLSIQFEHQTKKMALLSDCCIALTAGDALAHTELFNVVQGEINKLKSPMVSEVVEKIKTCYQSIREREINERILNPRGFRDFSEFYKAQRVMIPETILPIQAEIDGYDYGLEILIGGMSGNTASIYGIYNPGTSKCFDAIGFHAIGSGGPHALNTLIARGCHQETALWEGTLIVYEAKKMAEKAPGVGARITNMSIMNSKGFF